MEFCRALHDLGFAFTAEEVANWVEAIDENGDYCVDNQEFLAFVKTQVNNLLTSGISGHSSLPESIGPAKKPRVQPVQDISSQKSLRKRQTSDVVTAAEVEQEVHLRKAQQRKAEADEERLKAEEEEGIEVLIEEELGQNPESGEGWTEYNFQASTASEEIFTVIVRLTDERRRLIKDEMGGREGNQWAARGRLDARNLQLDLEGEGGRSVAYADASLVIEEGQVPELQGTWRAEDGSYGTFEGLKVCRESRIGGVWRLEIQAGGDPIEHAWNAWLTAHPADSEGDARASHLLRITGAALAGPFLSEKETVERHPTLMGEFNSLTRSLHVEMSSEGQSERITESLHDLPLLTKGEKWDGLILDAELGTDGALRGAWQRGEQSGRWIARHIGKKNTQGTFKRGAQ
eukprot:g23140.t2